MKKIYILLFILSIFKGFSQEETIRLYKTLTDYNNRDLSEKYKAKIVSEGEKYVAVKTVIDSTSAKEVHNWNWSSAVNYKNKNYFNIGYSDLDIRFNTLGKIFISFDVEGRYSLMVIDEQTEYINREDYYYGGGLTGVLMNDSANWKRKWRTQKGDKKLILFIDTQTKKTYDLRMRVLNRNKLKKILKKHKVEFDEKEVKEYSYEKVIELIESINKDS